MATPTRPTSTELCTFTTPGTEDPGRAYSAPIRTSCEAPSGLTVGDDVEPEFDSSGNPVFGEPPDTSEEVCIDPMIHSVEDLAALETTEIVVGSAGAIKMFIDSATGTVQVWQLETSIASHDPINGNVRPNDFNTLSNPKVWFLKTFTT